MDLSEKRYDNDMVERIIKGGYLVFARDPEHGWTGLWPSAQATEDWFVEESEAMKFAKDLFDQVKGEADVMVVKIAPAQILKTSSRCEEEE